MFSGLVFFLCAPLHHFFFAHPYIILWVDMFVDLSWPRQADKICKDLPKRKQRCIECSSTSRSDSSSESDSSVRRRAGSALKLRLKQQALQREHDRVVRRLEDALELESGDRKACEDQFHKDREPWP